MSCHNDQQWSKNRFWSIISGTKWTINRPWKLGGIPNTTDLFIYLGFYVAFNTVQVISRRVVGRAEETSTYSSLGFCIVNCRPTASNYQLSHLRPCRGSNPGLRGGRRECYHSATVVPPNTTENQLIKYLNKCVPNVSCKNPPIRILKLQFHVI